MQSTGTGKEKARGRPIRHSLTMQEAAYLHLTEIYWKLEQRIKKLEEKSD